MNILFIPSFSMRSYSKDLWLLSRDAHYTQVEAIGYRLKLRGWNVSVLMPNKADVLLFNNGYRDLKWMDPVVYKKYGKNILEQRQNIDSINSIVGSYDVVVTGHPEYASGLRKKYPFAIIASILTHGPLLVEEYLIKNIENFDNSNVIFYNFKKSKFPAWFLIKYESKLNPLLVYADLELVKHQKHNPIENILFLSRLSDKSRYDAEVLKTTSSSLSNKYNIFYTDPTESLEQIPHATLLFQRSKAEFIEILDCMDLIVIPYSIEETYSVSYFEALARGCEISTLRTIEHFNKLDTNNNFSTLKDLSSKTEFKNYTSEVILDAIPYYVSAETVDNFVELLTKQA